jgi:hypothetical protein
MRITVEGISYELSLRELTWEHDLELYKATGLTLPEITNTATRGGVAPFMVAAFVFLARRQAGDEITYEQVAEAINYQTLADDFSIEIIEVDETSPEALAAD